MAHGAPLKLHHGSAITGREQSLIVGLEMEPVEGVLINKEVTGLGGGSDAVVGDNSPSFLRDPIHGPGLQFHGDDVLTFTQSGDTKTEGTIAVTVRDFQPLVGTNYIFYGVTGATNYRIFTSGGAGVLSTRFGNAATQAANFTPLARKTFRILVTWQAGHVYVYIDGNLTDDYAAVFQDDLATGYIGANTVPGDNGWEGDLHEYILSRKFTTAAEAKRDYIQYARRAWYQENLRAAHVSSADQSGGRLENTSWNITAINGEAFRVVDAPELEALSRTPNVKAIRCINDGQIWIPTQALGLKSADPEAAYGTHEFWIKHAADSNTDVYFISDTNNPAAVNGYVLRIITNERLLLREFTGGVGNSILRTVVGYFPVDTWTHIRLARRYDGRFTVFVNEIPIAAVDIDLGSNPVTDNTWASGSYVLLDLDAGDEFGLMSQKWGEML